LPRNPHFNRLSRDYVGQPWVYVTIEMSDLNPHSQVLFYLALKSPFKMAMESGESNSSLAASRENELLKEP
jgi:hypothetical protein